MGNQASTSASSQQALQASSFDESRFTQISPTSTLSDPSKFCFRPTPTLQRSMSRVIVRDLPPLHGHGATDSQPLLKKKKKKKKKRATATPTTTRQKVRQVLAGCMEDSAQVAEQVRLASCDAMAKCATKTKKEWKHATNNVTAKVKTALVHPGVQIHSPGQVNYGDEHTPKLNLFAAPAYHREDEYFDRLAGASVGPSPFVRHHRLEEYDLTDHANNDIISNSSPHSPYRSPDEDDSHFDEYMRATPGITRAQNPDVSAMMSVYTDEKSKLNSTYLSLYVTEQEPELSFMTSPVAAMLAKERQANNGGILLSPMEAPTPQPSIFRLADVSAMMDDSFFQQEEEGEVVVAVHSPMVVKTAAAAAAVKPPVVIATATAAVVDAAAIKEEMVKPTVVAVVADKPKAAVQVAVKPAVVETPVVVKPVQRRPVVVEKTRPVENPVVVKQTVVDERTKAVEKPKAAFKPSLLKSMMRKKQQSVKAPPVRTSLPTPIVQPLRKESMPTYKLSTRSLEERESAAARKVPLRESAPTVLETRDYIHRTQDYRNIALASSDSSDIQDVMPVQSNEGVFASPAPNHRLAIVSPGMDSVMSTPGQSPVPLLSNQCLSNAAFLFSPSYAGGNAALLPKPGASISTAFSISTFPSRSRLGSSSRSQPSVTIPVSGTWDSQSLSRTTFSRTSWSREEDKNVKQVRFSTSNAFYEIEKVPPCEVEKTSVSMVVSTAIETKVSDLSETSSMFGKTLLSPTSVPSLASGKGGWAYREENGREVATPFISKKMQEGNGPVPAKSPMLRFRSAKDKFANPQLKTTPAKKTPPKKYWNRTPKKSLVSTRIADLAVQLNKNAPSGNRSMKASSIQLTHSNDEYNSTQQLQVKNVQSAPAAPYDEASSLGDSKASVARSISVVSTAESEDVFATLRTIAYEDDGAIPDDESAADAFASLLAQPTEEGDDESAADQFPNLLDRDDESAADAFADLLAQPTEEEDDDQTAPTVIRPRVSNQSSAQYTVSTYATCNTDKENSIRRVSLNSLHKTAVGESKVNPGQVHQHNNQGLHLSPLQRTPMQARRWRSLAAAAKEKEKKLSERSANVPARYR